LSKEPSFAASPSKIQYTIFNREFDIEILTVKFDGFLFIAQDRLGNCRINLLKRHGVCLPSRLFPLGFILNSP
jgi:hypothetical protein